MNEHDDPDIKIAGLSVWIDGYQFPEARDYWDANWVRVRARCIGQRATVEIADPCIHLPELASWAEACEALHAGRTDSAPLQTLEPYLQVGIDRPVGSRGLLLKVRLTPDNVTQFHEFRFPIDQSYVPRLVESIRRVLATYPVRGSQRH